MAYALRPKNPEDEQNDSDLQGQGGVGINKPAESNVLAGTGNSNSPTPPAKVSPQAPKQDFSMLRDALNPQSPIKSLPNQERTGSFKDYNFDQEYLNGRDVNPDQFPMDGDNVKVLPGDRPNVDESKIIRGLDPRAIINATADLSKTLSYEDWLKKPAGGLFGGGNYNPYNDPQHNRSGSYYKDGKIYIKNPYGSMGTGDTEVTEDFLKRQYQKYLDSRPKITDRITKEKKNPNINFVV